MRFLNFIYFQNWLRALYVTQTKYLLSRKGWRYTYSFLQACGQRNTQITCRMPVYVIVTTTSHECDFVQASHRSVQLPKMANPMDPHHDHASVGLMWPRHKVYTFKKCNVLKCSRWWQDVFLVEVSKWHIFNGIVKLRSHEQSFCATFRTPCSLCWQISVGL